MMIWYVKNYVAFIGSKTAPIHILTQIYTFTLIYRYKFLLFPIVFLIVPLSILFTSSKVLPVKKYRKNLLFAKRCIIFDALLLK